MLARYEDNRQLRQPGVLSGPREREPRCDLALEEAFRADEVTEESLAAMLGEVASVLNMTKDFSFAFMEIGVAYREDTDQVVELLRELGDGMQADEEFGPLILEPLEVLGLDSFGASSVNIRIRLKTLPIKQWAVKREYQRRMKRAFDERDIEIPFPHQTVYFGTDKTGAAPAARIAVENAGQGDVGVPPSGTPEPPEGERQGSERS